MARLVKALAASAALGAFVSLCVPVHAQTSASAEIWATQGADCGAEPGEAAPWWNTSYSPECRARFVLGQFATLEEKLLFLGGLSYGLDVGADENAPQVRDVARELGLPVIAGADGPAGLTRGAVATAMPAPLTVAASFNPEIAALYGRIVAAEFRAAGTGTILGPAYDIARNWRFGRLAESMGEDPFLTAEMAAAQVGALTEGGVLTMMKHYAVYSQDAGRVGDQPSGSGPVGNNIVSERAMREIYLPGFEAAVRRGGAGGVMCSFPRINGVFACEHPQLFDILKVEWGFDGYVGPDFPSAQRSITRAVLAGLDSGSWGPSTFNAALAHEKPLADAVRDGEVPMARIDDMVLRRLIPHFRLGLYDNPPVRMADNVSTPAHRAAAADIIAAGAVLLRNAGGVLPLGPDVRSIAVIGPQASEAAVVALQGSPFVEAAHFAPAFPAIAARAGDGVAVNYAPGTLGLSALPPPDPAQFTAPGGQAGFRARYYASADLGFAGELLGEAVVADPALAAAPAGLPGRNQWSVRYDSSFTPATGGVHRFTLHGSGSARLWIDGKEVGTFEHADFGNAIFANVELRAGQPVEIRIDYTPRAALRAERMAMFGMEMGLTLRFGHAGPDDLIAQAVEAARAADVAVVFAGELVGEGMDRISLSLQGDQDRLIAAVAAVNPRTVVVLNTGGPVAMPWLDDVAGVLAMWHPGDAFGPAVAGLLFGDRDPGGRLPITFPADATQGAGTKPYQMPGLIDPVTGALGDALYDEGVFVGYRFFDAAGQEPLFPFGYGLSYADIGMEVLGARLSADRQELEVQLRLANRSTRAGTAVPQLYVGLPAGAGSPPWQLKGFASLRLGPGEAQSHTIRVPLSELRHWDSAARQWRLAAGTYALRLGTSARDPVWEGQITLPADFSAP
ncbi:beta-glucosidase [Alteraurantiacibacter palmitatis]|uniref:Glycoside hydrolase family 3 protein n=1 Tax=Alteraurantiacibacter palmitatis TaxID=2054628 RepID=A0ABV7E3N0_9SPHN